MESIKTYELIIDEENREDGVQVISFVGEPAVERDFMLFNNDKNLNFAIENEEQHEVLGVIMLADTPIYRGPKPIYKLSEHNVIFSKETIKKIVLKYSKEKKFDRVNLEHSIDAEGVYMFESYIVNKSLGINAPSAFVDIPDGSWIGRFKVENDNIWGEIKSGKFNGFSIEGMFDYKFNDEIKSEKDELLEIWKMLWKIENKK